MNTQAQIQKLEGLLARVRQNNAKPRPERDVEVQLASPPQPIEDIDIEDFDEADIEDITESAPPEAAPPALEFGSPASIGEALGKVAEQVGADDLAAAGASGDDQDADDQDHYPRETSLEIDDIVVDEIEAADITADEVVMGDDSAEFDVPTHSAELPTTEQLGGVVELQGADAPSRTLELVETVESEPPPASGQLEAAIPSRRSVGNYGDLPPPSTAQADLDAHFGSSRPVQVASPEVLTRPETDVSRPVAQVIQAKPLRDESFVELLDASMRLGG